MAIDSHFYDTLPGKGINEIEWAESAASRGPIYGVASKDELLCTPHPSTPYAVNISPAPNGFWGHGVWDTSDSIVTVTFAPPASGARRFDLVAGHRDWTPTGGGPTTIAGVQGSATRALPSGRATSPGEVDDQPLWLVEWVGGQTQPQSITDLRLIGGRVGVDALALKGLPPFSAPVTISGVDYRYEPIGNGNWDWVGYRPSGLLAYSQPAFFETGWSASTEVGVAQLVVPDPGVPYRVRGVTGVTTYADSAAGLEVKVRLDSIAGPVLGALGHRPAGTASGLGLTVAAGLGGISDRRTGPVTVLVTCRRVYGSGGWAITRGGNALGVDLVLS